MASRCRVGRPDLLNSRLGGLSDAADDASVWPSSGFSQDYRANNFLSGNQLYGACTAQAGDADAIMDISTALRAIESKKSSEAARGQAESGDVKMSAEELAALLPGIRIPDR